MIAYLATPFTDYHAGYEAAFIEASRIGGLLAKQGVRTFGPISMGYPMMAYAHVSNDAEFWKDYLAPFVAVSDSLIVAMMDGWRTSEGVTHEIAEFRRAGKPIVYLDPVTMAFAEPMGRVA